MSFLLEIKDRLVGQGVGVYGTNIFIGSRAEIPRGDGPYLSINATGGIVPALTHGDTATERPTAQILVRAKTFQAVQTMVAAAYSALGGANGLWNAVLSGTMYLKVLARQHPTDMGLDADGRQQFVFNIDVEKQPS